MLPRLLLVVVCILAVSTEKQERKSIKLARSSFFYDKKILQKLIRLEHKAKLREQAMRDWETRMENTLTKFEQKKTNMSATIATADKIMSDIQRNMTAWETVFQENLQSHNLTVQSFLEDYRTPTVLFKARLVSSTTITVGKALVFTEVIANVVDGYDNCTGYFTAPVPGTYMFTAQLCTPSTGSAHVYMVANGTKVESTFHKGVSGAGECVTLTGVSVLDEGETARVEGSYTTTNALKENLHRWNTFSGILINTVL